MLMMPMMGLGMAAGVLAGQNLGAARPERAVKSGWLAAFMAEGFMFVWVVVLFFGAENVVRLFNSEAALVEMGATFLRIASISYLVVGFPMVFQNCIAGAGETLPPMILSLVGTWCLQLPLAYLLPRITNLGVYGIRWAGVIATFIGASFFVAYFMTGRWQKKRV